MAELEHAGCRLAQLDALLTAADEQALPANACQTLVELSAELPGRRARVVEALRRQRDSAALDALLALPSQTPGVVEAVFAGLRHGVARSWADQAASRMLALEFRSSKSRRFPALVERATAAFGAGLERLRVGDTLHYRFAVFERSTPKPELQARVGPLALDIEGIHRDLLRLRGVRLWLNGWCFDDASPLRPPVRVPLLRGWLDWATSGER